MQIDQSPVRLSNVVVFIYKVSDAAAHWGGGGMVNGDHPVNTVLQYWQKNASVLFSMSFLSLQIRKNIKCMAPNGILFFVLTSAMK